MKLANRYQRINLLATLLVFLLASTAFYFLLQHILVNQIDEDIAIEQHEMERYIKSAGKLPYDIVPVADRIVHFEKVREPLPKVVRHTVYLQDPVEHDNGHFRQFVFSVRAGTEWYNVTLSKSLESTEILAQSISLIALATVVLMLLVSLLINRIILRRLWRPFYTAIDNLRSFRISGKEKLELPFTAIDEFALLNDALQLTTGKAAQDYRVLKEFTENASHELQTPLAIIRSKLDLLIQDETLSENQSHVIQDAYDAIGRMTHLNSSLLSLAKMENGQYGDRSVINMKQLLDEKLELFEPVFQSSDIQMEVNLADAWLSMNPLLADILLNNLIGNATHHNHKKGSILITLNPDELIICNTSDTGVLNQEFLFTRFYKSNKVGGGTGLGLAIVRQVCIISGCNIGYRFNKGLHCFFVKWNDAKQHPDKSPA